jgi:hypothetical protein
VRYELGFYIPEDGILHSHRRENLTSEGQNAGTENQTELIFVTGSSLFSVSRNSMANLERKLLLQPDHYVA